MASYSNRISSAGGRLAWLSSPWRGITRGGGHCRALGPWIGDSSPTRACRPRSPRLLCRIVARATGALSSRSMAKTPQPAHRRHGPRCRGARASSTSMQLTMAAAAEHVRADIVLAAADDEPALALEWRKTHVPPEVKEWLDWSLAACLRFTIRALPDIFTAVQADLSTGRWLAMVTPGSLAVHSPCIGWCRVARLQTLFILHWCWAFVAARHRCAHEWAPGDTWRSLPLLTVRSRIIKLDETCCKMLPIARTRPVASQPHGSASCTCVPCTSAGQRWAEPLRRAREGVARSQ